MTGLQLVRCPECGGSVFSNEPFRFTPWLCVINLAASLLISWGLLNALMYETPGGCEVWHISLLEALTHGYFKSNFNAAAFSLVAGPVIAGIMSVFRPTTAACRLALAATLTAHLGLVLLDHRVCRYDPGLAFNPLTIGLVIVSLLTVSSLWFTEYTLRLRWHYPTPSCAPRASSCDPSSLPTAQPGSR